MAKASGSKRKKPTQKLGGFEFMTTPVKAVIKSAQYMSASVVDVGYAKNQLSEGKFEMQVCRGSGAWYQDKIGQEFDVLPFNETHVRVNNPSGCGFYFIAIRDCEIKNEAGT